MGASGFKFIKNKGWRKRRASKHIYREELKNKLQENTNINSIGVSKSIDASKF